MLQSEAFKEGMKDYKHYAKAVVVGSPKLDRVIKLCNEGGQIPIEWESVLVGKKCDDESLLHSGMYGNPRLMEHLQFLKMFGMNHLGVELRSGYIFERKLGST